MKQHKTKRSPQICECGHHEMVHVSGCFVKGCKCKQFKPKKLKGGETT